MTESEKLAKLKELLLDEDRELAHKILSKLDSVETTLNTQEKLSEKVNPIIDGKLSIFVEEIPEKLGPTITQALSTEIKKSQDKVVEALFPIIGKMIKKYIQQEIKALSDAVNNQVQSTFSVTTWKRKFKAYFSGKTETEVILSELNKGTIEQVFMIEKGSGLIIASASREERVDEDMIAGMLTAIKSFVEDAFKKDNQSLELIQYELSEIYIQNFTSYYFAVVISGGFDNALKNEIENKLFDIASAIQPDSDEKEELNEKFKILLNHE